MKLRTHLREIRGSRTLKTIADSYTARAGKKISRGALSELERGVRLATDAQIQVLEQVYGAPVHDWYPPRVLVVLELDQEEHP